MPSSPKDMQSMHINTPEGTPTVTVPNGTVESFPAGDVTLAYRLVGAATPTRKTPVLFIHGLSYFSYDWVAFGQAVCQDRQGCAMDMRGFGDSSFSPGQDYSVPTMAGDIGRLLDHLGWDRVILVAHSMGGRVAAYFAAHHPQQVEALVLVDWSPENAAAGTRRVATTVAGTPEVFASVEDAMRHFGSDPDSPDGQDRRIRFTEYTRPVAGGVSIKRDPHFSRQFRRLLDTGEKAPQGVDLWQVVADITVPTLVLRGTRSDLFAAETLPKVLQRNPRFKALEIDAGHHIAGDNPAATLSAIRQFIQP